MRPGDLNRLNGSGMKLTSFEIAKQKCSKKGGSDTRVIKITF